MNQHYSHTNGKGATYYLYGREQTLKSGKQSVIYFFAKSNTNDKGVPLAEVPHGRIVAETKNGLPVLRKAA